MTETRAPLTHTTVLVVVEHYLRELRAGAIDFPRLSVSENEPTAILSVRSSWGAELRVTSASLPLLEYLMENLIRTDKYLQLRLEPESPPKRRWRRTSNRHCLRLWIGYS
jgi:hypothetical protein